MSKKTPSLFIKHLSLLKNKLQPSKMKAGAYELLNKNTTVKPRGKTHCLTLSSEGMQSSQAGLLARGHRYSPPSQPL
jgi:hypothetical protein